MKTPSFWYEPDSWTSRLLSPFGAAYGWAARTRRARTKPVTAAVPLICVGNIVAGGAGKTPTTLALIKLAHAAGATPHVVLRGYGGSLSGPQKVHLATHSVHEVGDEALLLAQVAPCWIGRDRVAAVRAATLDATHLLMDDGFQNPHLAPDISLLVIDGATGLGNGRLIPAGPLRESPKDALRRTSAVILIGEDRHNIAALIQDKPLFRAHLEPALPASFPHGETFVAFSGLARPEKFFATCGTLDLKLAATRSFPDHHLFTAPERTALLALAKSHNARLITTSKDYARLPQNFRPHVTILPVDMLFDDPQALSRFCGF